MNFIFWTLVCTAIMFLALFYIIKLSIKRKNNADYPNYLFIAISIFLICGIFTGIQIFDLSFKWTNSAPTVEGTCKIEMASKSTSIYFEDKNLTLSTSMWSDIKFGKYDNCKATYYPITKEIIEFMYENKLQE